MKKITRKVQTFITNEEGLTTVEYAVAGAVVAAAVLLAFTELGAAVAGKVAGITTAITG